jgi:hypothetical protein
MFDLSKNYVMMMKGFNILPLKARKSPSTADAGRTIGARWENRFYERGVSPEAES